jgi:hypothetical protein
MIGTGCSGSGCLLLLYRASIDPDTANAVRYGTAKAEWFLNVVSPVEHFHKEGLWTLESVLDSSSSIREGDQDTPAGSQVFCGL